MPNGVVHRRLWVSNFPNAILATALGVRIHPVIGAGIAAGYLLGNIVEPDLDLIQKTRSENAMLDKLGAIGCVWFGYWATYGCLFRKHHRSWLSHGLFIGTIIRFAYLFLWYSLLSPVLTIDLFMVGLLIGLAISDAVHIIADWLLTSDGKRKSK